MTRDEIYAMIVEGLASTFQIDRARIIPSARLYDDLDLDSIDAVDIAAKLQTETGIRLAPLNFKAVVTVGDLIAALEEPLSGKELSPVVTGAGDSHAAPSTGSVADPV